MRSERPRRAGARLHVAVAAAVIAFVVLPATPASAAVITVNTTNDELNNDGDCSLREAIEAANMDQPVSGCPAGSGPDQINVPAGRYQITIPEPAEAGNSQGDFDLHSDVAIAGAGIGATIVSGGGANRVFEHHSFGHTSSIAQLSIRSGDATNAVGFHGGGGIFNNGGSSLAVDAVEVRGSTAPQGGGGIYSFGSLTVTNSTVARNSAPGIGGGGGIATQNGDLTVQSSVVTLNTAAEGAAGIENSNSIMSITDSTVSANAGSANGPGGIANHGFATLTDTTVADNTAGQAAGILNFGELSIEGGTVIGNVAAEHGGGISNIGRLGMNAVTIAHNTTDGTGGGLASFDGYVEIVGTTFTGNESGAGGGGIRMDGELLMTGGSLEGNRAAELECCGGGAMEVGSFGTATLQGVAVTGNFSAQDSGGGIFNFGRLTLQDAVVSGNEVVGQGGGIHQDPGSFLRMTGGEISHNTAHSGGGLSAEGIPEAGGSWTRLEGVLVEGNVATEGPGGGLIGEGPEATISVANSEFTGNSSPASGGGIEVGPAHATIADSSIVGNDAVFGGGVSAGDGTLLLERSGVSGNAADLDGGGVLIGENTLGRIRESTVAGNEAFTGGGIWNAGDLDVRRSTVRGNSAEFGGGIADVPDSVTRVRESTISGNDAEYGGGISEQGNLVLFQSTVSGNTADVEGGGLQVWTNHGPIGGGGEGNALFRFSTLARNSAPFAAAYNNQAGESEVVLENTIVGDSVGGADCEWRFHSGGYNIIENPGPSCSGTGATSTDLIGVDPRLGALAANGGPTMTHALRPGSPAIDSANANCPPPSADQRGVPRGFPDGCDRGAFERSQGGLLFFELHDAQVSSGRVQAAGSLLCAPAGHRWRADVTVTQSDATGRATFGGICTGEEQPWNAVVRPGKGSPPFAPGAAVWCQNVRTTTPAGAQTDRDQECFDIELG